MKFLITILIFSSVAFAKEEKKAFSVQLEENKYYYSALNEFFKETHSKEISKDHLTRLEELLFFTGIEILEDYDSTLLSKYPTSSTRFILGRQAIKKDPKRALKLFGAIHPDHRYYPEGMLLESQVHATAGDMEKSHDSTQNCVNSAEKMESNSPSEKIKKYFKMVGEICLANKARRHFNLQQNDQAIDAYNKIPKKSYKWPYVILEKALVYYEKGDYNRALGLLVTYKSPLMDTYFFPEAEYLTALAYYKLCLYDDSLTVINQYYSFYRPKFMALQSVLVKNQNSPTYFYDLMFKPSADLAAHEDFVRQIITRLKKQTRFSLDFNTIHKINQETKLIYAQEKGPKLRMLLEHLSEVKKNMIARINYNAKSSIFDFLETVPFYSSELFKLNLDVLSKKKDLVYKNRSLVGTRDRGDFSNIKRSRFEQFWKFQGEFWADELGDYSLGLESSCKVERTKTEEE